jgi:hypothetical protein
MKRNIAISNKETQETIVVTVLAEKIENQTAACKSKQLLCALSETEFTYVTELPLLHGVWYTTYDLVWTVSENWPKERIFNDIGFPALVTWL